MKFCKLCQQDRPETEFTKNSRSSDGLWCYCKSCDNARAAARRAANPLRVKAIMQKSVAKHREAINARRRARRAADPHGTKAQRKADYEKYRERELATMARWKAANRTYLQERQAARYWTDPTAARQKQNNYRATIAPLVRSWRMARNAAKLAATPHWADLNEIRLAYEAADLLMQVTGEWYEVDHIVPLRGAVGRRHVVCGLHVAHNLQVIPKRDNRKKSNVTWPDMA